MIQPPFDSHTLERFFNSCSPPAEQAMVMEWLHSLSAEEQEAFFDRHLAGIEQMMPAPGEQQVPAFDSIRPALKQRTFSHLLIKWGSMAAAAAILGWSIWYLPAPTPNNTLENRAVVTTAPVKAVQIHKHNDTKLKQRLLLPDSSVAVLSAGATIDYPADFGQDRSIEMTGTVYFDVHKDPHHPFIVKAGKMTTRVLGTSFTVRAGSGSHEWSVVVHTGRVQVAIGTDTPLLLAAGERAGYHIAAGTLAKYQPPAVPAPVVKEWTNIAFDQTPLRTVAKAIAEKYQVEVIIKDNQLIDKPVSLSIRQQTLTALLEELQSSFHINYELQGEQVILY